MKKRVLLVEDHPDTVRLMSIELEMLGYDVIVARNGLEAVELAASEQPDLIVMDILVPQLNGLQAAVHIRRNPKTQRIPILAATGLGREQDRADCIASGCDDLIVKPFTYRELGLHIRRLLSA